MFRKLSPEKVFVTEDVYQDQAAVACVKRIMTAVCGVTEQRVSYDELNAIAAQRWQTIPRWGCIDDAEKRDPDLVLTTAKFWDEETKTSFIERYPNLKTRDLAGFFTWSRRPDGDQDWRQRTKGCVCQSAWELKSAIGCPFRCAYCNLGGVIRLFVNMEEYIEHLDEICGFDPDQRLYKWDNITDVSCFEPEWGATRLLVDYFARKEGKYFEIYTGKSDNIDNLLDLDHRGKTIIQWSVSARTQSTVIEPETAPWNRRIDAAKKCQDAGYTVRYRFSPIIPVKNWQEENAELIRYMFEQTAPDVISLCSFGWMSNEDANACLDMSLLDDQYVQAMAAAVPFLNRRGFTSGGGRPIPHDARAAMFKFLIDEIRKHNATIPISLCLETVEMWALFGHELGMPINPHKPVNYYCNCGPMCTSEHPLSQSVKPGRSWFDENADK